MAQDSATAKQNGRGKLRIFLGYAAGVGKTYAMLQAARQRQAEGIEVVVGQVNTHGLPDTEKLLAGLEVLPRRPSDNPNATLAGVDLDGLRARRPQLALIDELVHANVPGARHAKRYQDVLELLEARIDVYTTLNIQHLESLNDIVKQITGLTVQETVPDYVLDEAAEVELIDLPVDELLQRLAEGKVHRPAGAEPAPAKFFRPGNLTALRELALRRAADRVDEQLRAYMESHAIPGPWPAGERLLVCVSPSPLSRRLVRAGRRLAARLNAEWFAVYVETPTQARLSEQERDRAARTLQLAETLGAKAVTLTARSVAEGLVSFARSRNVNKIVAGKPLRPRWTELWRGSIVDQIIRASGDLDIYVISGAPGPSERVTKMVSPDHPRPEWARYGQSAVLVALATLAGFPLRAFVEPTNLVMLYLLAVVIAALYLGRLPAMLASLLSLIAFNYVFVPPYYTYVVADAQFLLTFAGLLVVGVVISTLAAQARDQARAAQRREAQTAALYDLSRDLAAAVDVAGLARAVVSHIEQVVGGQAAIFLDRENRLELCAQSQQFNLDENARAAAEWVWQHGQTAGAGTDTLAEAGGAYLPLKTTRQVVGVLGVRLVETERGLSREQWRLLESFASQTAQAIDRFQLAEEAGQAQLLRETEKLQTALLNSISHDLRTPLASITGSLSSLRDDAAYLDEAARRELIGTAYEQADRLNALVGNLLEMTRLEAGATQVKRELCDVQDVIGVALAQLAHRLAERPVEAEVPADLPLVPLDFVLLVQVLVNVLDNAHKYSPPGRPITIRVHTTESELTIEVIDWGIGIPENELERVFAKFYRVQPGPGISGTGLGLSISKGIVEAHHGRIWAEREPEGGTKITLALPLAAQPVSQRAEAE